MIKLVFHSYVRHQQAQIVGNQLTPLHSDFYLASGTYQVLIQSGVVHGVSGGNYTGLNEYSINIIGLSDVSVCETNRGT